jgi:hypothetical protein
MIEFPLNKALVAVEVERSNWCTGCWFYKHCLNLFKCGSKTRQDGKNVIYKIVDYHPDPLERLAGVINGLSNDPPLTKEEVDALLSGLRDKGSEYGNH